MASWLGGNDGQGVNGLQTIPSAAAKHGRCDLMPHPRRVAGADETLV